MSNRHPADELAETRNKIRALKEYEECLRLEIIGLPRPERIGSKYAAMVSNGKRRTLDIEKLQDEIGDITRFYKEVEFTIVKIGEIKDGK